MSAIYFITGASGSGKTAIIPSLKRDLGDAIVVYDFDEIGVPKDADIKWRQMTTEKWLQKLLSEGKDACLIGQMVLGEILACPSAKHIAKINLCFLDVSDFERIQRLKKCNTYGVDQNMLNWSSYLRMHHQDPQWMQQVIKKDALATLDFSVWEQLSSWDSKAKIEFIDTTGLDLDDVSNKVVYWINNVNINSVDLVPNTDYKVYKNPKNAVAMVDEKLHAYNKQCVAPTQTPDVINVNYVIKDNEEMIAGICADIYVWKILYISLLFVEKNYRNQDLASYLLNKVEAEARTIGVKLVHLDTFAFQAKDFYLKHGYEIFGVLDDCPEGYKRYYLKKVL